MHKFPESKYLEPETELGHFPGMGAVGGTLGTLNSELEPNPEQECFPGVGS